MTGFGTSVIGCGAEAGIDRELEAGGDARRPPRRARAALRFLARSCGQQLENRVGQCVLTSPARPATPASNRSKRIGLGQGPRFFGDGFQTAKRLGDKRYWRVPVMDGEFVFEETTGIVTDAVGGGNLIILGNDRAGAAGSGGGRRRRHRRRAGRHHAVPRRHRALRLQGRLQVQGRHRLDQRRLLPDAARRA